MPSSQALLLALAASITSSSGASLRHRYRTAPSNTTSPAPASSGTSDDNAPYTLISSYTNTSFFSHFTAFSDADPTNGHVQYQTMASATQESLLGFIYNETSNANTAYIGVDYTNPAPQGRKSVRLTSKETFDVGSLFVVDVRHAPSQWGAWPAIWMLGSGEQEWPANGESDILEYVHMDDHNGMTLHTAPGCVVDNVTTSSTTSSKGYGVGSIKSAATQSQQQQGSLANTNCNAGNGATGCSVKAYNQNTFSPSPSAKRDTSGAETFSTAGPAFNAQGGSVYIHSWTPSGIAIWSFPRDSLPADLLAGAPQPSTWTATPLAVFRGSGCDFTSAFQKMQIIINITFCGDWAGKVWESSGAAKATGAETCEAYVSNNPDKFEDAYFEIGGMWVYSNVPGAKPGSGPAFE